MEPGITLGLTIATQVSMELVMAGPYIPPSQVPVTEPNHWSCLFRGVRGWYYDLRIILVNKYIY